MKPIRWGIRTFAFSTMLFCLISVTALAEDGNESVSIGITSNVSGAEVTIDGRLAGKTPLYGVKLVPGSHKVELKKDGYAPAGRDLLIDATGGSYDISMQPLDTEKGEDAVVPAGAGKTWNTGSRTRKKRKKHDLESFPETIEAPRVLAYSSAYLQFSYLPASVKAPAKSGLPDIEHHFMNLKVGGSGAFAKDRASIFVQAFLGFTKVDEKAGYTTRIETFRFRSGLIGFNVTALNRPFGLVTPGLTLEFMNTDDEAIGALNVIYIVPQVATGWQLVERRLFLNPFLRLPIGAAVEKADDFFAIDVGVPLAVRMFDQVYASASFDFRFAVEPVTEETITFVPSLFYQRKNVSFKVAFPVRAYPDDNFWYRWAMMTYFAGQF